MYIPTHTHNGAVLSSPCSTPAAPSPSCPPPALPFLHFTPIPVIGATVCVCVCVCVCWYVCFRCLAAWNLYCVLPMTIKLLLLLLSTLHLHHTTSSSSFSSFSSSSTGTEATAARGHSAAALCTEHARVGLFCCVGPLTHSSRQGRRVRAAGAWRSMARL